MALVGNMDVQNQNVNMGIGAVGAAPGQQLPVLRRHNAAQGRAGGGYPWPYDSRHFGGVPAGAESSSVR